MSGVHLVDGLPDNGGEFTKGLRVLADVLIELLEGGWRPKRSRVLPALIATLERLEGGES